MLLPFYLHSFISVNFLLKVKDIYFWQKKKLFLKKKKLLKYTIRADELNLTNRTELFVNFKRAELELKKRFVSNSSWVSSRTNSYRVESSSGRFDSTRLISSPSVNGTIDTKSHLLNWINLEAINYSFKSARDIKFIFHTLAALVFFSSFLLPYHYSLKKGSSPQSQILHGQLLNWLLPQIKSKGFLYKKWIQSFVYALVLNDLQQLIHKLNLHTYNNLIFICDQFINFT